MARSERIAFLESKAYNLRLLSLKQTTQAGSGHPTSCLSAADIVAVLFFYTMHFDPQDWHNPDNDHFILSKGHAAPVLYAAWAELGIVKAHDLLSYRQMNSPFEGHPTMNFSRTEAATGSLGMGLSIGLGMALNARKDNRNYKTYVLLGDSEIAEGSVWEAVQLAAHYKMDNLVAIIDVNALGQTGQTLYVHHSDILQRIFTAYGWHVHQVDGHDIPALCAVMDSLKESYGAPVVILANTIKGYGIDGIEGKNGFHGKAFDKTEYQTIVQHMQERFYAAAHYEGGYAWHPNLPIPAPHPVSYHAPLSHESLLANNSYALGDRESTRKAFGKALVVLGSQDDRVMVLDAEVKNSTYTEFFQEQFPDRFIECFIAEQNMVSVGVGLDRLKKKVFMATFASFLSRAHDQLRMAAIGRSTIKVVGTHAGISIGQDGPSQMGLEDIALMRGLPESIVLYPCDAVSTYKLVELMATYDRGIAYLRATRMETPVIYDAGDHFTLGGLRVLKESDNDRACIVAVGVTLHEALKAHDLLLKEGISVAVVDLYSVKPLDAKRLEALGRKSSGRIITVEDHYEAGGIGEAVSAALSASDVKVERCAVMHVPRSGKPEELLAWAGIDAHGIVKKVKRV
jgi:transketolase